MKKHTLIVIAVLLVSSVTATPSGLRAQKLASAVYKVCPDPSAP